MGQAMAAEARELDRPWMDTSLEERVGEMTTEDRSADIHLRGSLGLPADQGHGELVLSLALGSADSREIALSARLEYVGGIRFCATDSTDADAIAGLALQLERMVGGRPGILPPPGQPSIECRSGNVRLWFGAVPDARERVAVSGEFRHLVTDASLDLSAPGLADRMGNAQVHMAFQWFLVAYSEVRELAASMRGFLDAFDSAPLPEGRGDQDGQPEP